MRKRIILAIVMIALVTVASVAQRSLLPWPKVQFVDQNGRPLAGGRIWTYVAGTTTPLATYPEWGGIGVNPNPVILDAAGRASIWITNQAYKIVVEDSTCQYRDIYGTCHGNVVFTVDNISPSAGIVQVVTFGGTGITTYATGDMLYASATNTLAKLTVGVPGKVLTVAASGLPAWSWPSIALATQTTGILPVSKGGTGIAFFGVAGPTAPRTYTFPDANTTIPRFLTASAELDFPSTSSESSSDLTIVLTGAVLGDVVALGIPHGSVEDKTSYMAWVSDVDEVMVRLNNYSPGAVDPVSGTFKVTIIR